MFKLNIGPREIRYSRDLVAAMIQCRDGVREGTEGLTPFKGRVHGLTSVSLQTSEKGAELVFRDGDGEERVRLHGAGTENDPYTSVKAYNLLVKVLRDEPGCREEWAKERAHEQAEKAAKAEKAKAFAHRPGRTR